MKNNVRRRIAEINNLLPLDEAFTRQHYVAIAKILAKHKSEQASAIAKELADLFAADNPNFDRNRFLQAAGA